jgi:polyisoprenoid-binding protein YceI
MNLRPRHLSFAAAAFLAAPAFAADTYLIDKNHSEAIFTIKHLVSRVSGRFGEFSGTLNLDQAAPAQSSVEFTINASSITTDQPDRDKHLKSPDFFAVEQYPTITFASGKISPAGANKYNVDGTLTMRGVSKPVTLPVEFLGFGKDPRGNEVAGFTLETTLNRKDYGILWNKALDAGGFVLADDVKIVINLEAVKKK